MDTLTTHHRTSALHHRSVDDVPEGIEIGPRARRVFTAYVALTLLFMAVVIVAVIAGVV